VVGNDVLVVGAIVTHTLWLYCVKRLLLIFPTLLGILIVAFTIIQFLPGGPVEKMLQDVGSEESRLWGIGLSANYTGQPAGVYRGRLGVDQQQIDELKALYGFDKPTHERFIKMVVGYAHLDFGSSFFWNKTVYQLIVEKLPVSASLGLWSFLLTYFISIPLGIAKAIRHGSRFDLYTSLAVLIGYSIPGFVLGIVMVIFFGQGTFFLQLFPLGGLVSDDFAQLSLVAKVLDYFWHLALPLACLVIGSFAALTMLTKNTVLEEIQKQYIQTARAKGLSETTILWKHALRNALIPILTGFPLAFLSAFFTGSLVIETLFSLDGLGLLSFEALMKRDYPVVMGILFLFSFLLLLAKLINDLLYVALDPRVRLDKRSG
jgi:microcin C transport system permease protein